MKKIFVLIGIIFISSCTLTQEEIPATFQDYYNRNTQASVDSIESTLKSFGLYRSSQTSGVFDALVSVPVLLSGSLSSNYDIQSDGQNASIDATNGVFQYSGLAGSGFLSFDKIGMISQGGNLYLLYKNLEDAGLATPEMRELFKKFDSTWLSWTREDSFQGMSQADIEVFNMLENINKLNSNTIKKYLTDYPLWKSTEDLGMNESLHSYKVILDEENVIALMNKITLDLTGTGLTSEDQADIRKDFSDVDLAGTMSFHPENTDILNARLTLTQSGNILATLSIDKSLDKIQVIVDNPESATKLSYMYDESETRNNILVTLSQSGTDSQSGTEVGRLAGYTEIIDGKFQELSLDATAQGITVSLIHTQKDGTYSGKLLLPVGSITWDGGYDDKKLNSMKVKGISPMGSLDLNLTASGEMMRGPFVLRVGEEELARALVGMIAESNRFRFSVDVPQSTESNDMMHAEFGLTMKSSEFKGKIKTPSSSKPMQDLFTELEQLVPEQFLEEPQGLEIDSAGQFIDDSSSFEPTVSNQ